MLNSIPIEIFKSFSKNELKSFEDFANSPFHNKKTSVTKLFIYIKKYQHDFNSVELGRENAWKELFPGKAYNYGVMKNLIYDLTKLTEEYISVIYNKDNDLQKELGIIKFLNERNRLKLVAKYLDKSESKHKKLEAGNAEYYKNIFDIQKIRLSLLAHKISDKHKIRPGAEFEQGTNYLMESFLISILENFVLINSLNKIHRSEIKMPMLEEVLNFVKRNESFLENLYVKVYYYILLLDREQDQRHYHLLKSILSEMEITSDNSFRYAIWENISNYYIQVSRW